MAMGAWPWRLLALCAVAASEDLEALRGKVRSLQLELRSAQAELLAAEAVCNARIRSAEDARDSAAEYLAKQHALRAPFYLKAARKSFEKGLKQLKGIDKSNSDPFIKQHEGQLQVVGALDLAPDSADIWLEAGKVSLSLASLADSEGEIQHVVAMFARAAQLDASKLEPALKWLQRKESKENEQEKQLRKILRGEVKRWNHTKSVPDVPVNFVSTLKQGICFKQGSKRAGWPEDVASIIDRFQERNVFPTKILSVNVLSMLPEGFADRLAGLAEAKYQQFSKKFPDIDPNDLNDKFFGFQSTHASRLGSGDVKKWPEMYRSEDFKILTRVMDGALRGFLERTGAAATEASDYDLVLWAAVYPGNGGRHGYHVHQGSASSCVLYAKVAGASTPISFIDPRGAPPVADYEQYEKERDFEPQAPFHHNEYFFPQPGDLVCFPSWLVHNVPSHWETETRVAFAANLQGRHPWDSWFHTAVAWHAQGPP
ncbi:unnamed protein product [Effrenium voratum]|nr:unnamed protein product [Effrenium voratum]